MSMSFRRCIKYLFIGQLFLPPFTMATSSKRDQHPNQCGAFGGTTDALLIKHMLEMLANALAALHYIACQMLNPLLVPHRSDCKQDGALLD